MRVAKRAVAADVQGMAKVKLNNDQSLVVPRKLATALSAARVEHADRAAQISDGDRQPALILIRDDELVLVSAKAAQRWPIAELARVGGTSILTEADSELPISGWWYAVQAQQFRAALRERIGQPPDEPHVPIAPVAAAAVDAGRLTRKVAILLGIVLLAIVASVVAWFGNVSRERVITPSVLAIFALALPLTTSSVRLVKTDSRWSGIGVAGAMVGGAALLLLAYAIFRVLSFDGCDGNCIGG